MPGELSDRLISYISTVRMVGMHNCSCDKLAHGEKWTPVGGGRPRAAHRVVGMRDRVC